MKVAVLGCGPAGLMAAHAATLAGATEVAIFSRRRKSELYGAQYLHSPIPGMTDNPPVPVRYQLRGSVEAYRAKVYGDSWDGEVSPDEHLGDHNAWDIRATYNNLWDRYSGRVYGTELSRNWVRNLMYVEMESGRFDHVISSIPKHATCDDPTHEFKGQSVWALGDAPERGIFAGDYVELENNVVVCNGLPRGPFGSDGWYRASKVFGYSTVEWPVMDAPGITQPEGATSLIKPLATNCDCWSGMIYVGRFGRWEKGVLADSAFHDVLDRLVTEPWTART